MHSLIRKTTPALLVISLSACTADVREATPDYEVATQNQALYGSLNTQSCTPQQRETIIAAHQTGMAIAMTDTLDACVRQRIYATYKPCHDGDGDSYWDAPTLTQYEKARDIMRSGNTAST